MIKNSILIILFSILFYSCSSDDGLRTLTFDANAPFLFPCLEWDADSNYVINFLKTHYPDVPYQTKRYSSIPQYAFYITADYRTRLNGAHFYFEHNKLIYVSIDSSEEIFKEYFTKKLGKGTDYPNRHYTRWDAENAIIRYEYYMVNAVVFFNPENYVE